MIGCRELQGELVDEGECVDCWMHIEPELLERKLRGTVECMFKLGQEGLIVLDGTIGRRDGRLTGSATDLEHVTDGRTQRVIDKTIVKMAPMLDKS